MKSSEYGGSGSYLGVFVTPGSGGLFNPYAIRFGPDGNAYVTSDNGSSQGTVLRYDRHGASRTS